MRYKIVDPTHYEQVQLESLQIVLKYSQQWQYLQS